MNKRVPITVAMGSKRRPGHWPIALAVASCLAQSAALAQNIPYQSGRRADFNRSAGGGELPPGLTFEPRVDAAVQYAYNTNVSSTDQESALGLELAPGAYVAYNTPRFTGAADYSLIGRLWNDGDLDDFTQALAANGNWTAIPELFSISGDASYSDILIDSQQGGNYGNLGVFNSGNISEQAAASVRPALEKHFNDFSFEATYSYGRVWYFDQGSGQSDSPFVSVAQDNSVNQQADVSLGLIPGERRYTGRFFYSWEHSDFDQSIPYQFERAGFDGGFELSRSISFVGDVGKESQLDESTTDGGLDSDFWSAGLRWEGSQRTSVEARYGDRFFGPSYFANIRHATRRLTFTGSYDESPDVETRRVNLDAFVPGELPPWFDPDIDAGEFNSQPYVGKNARIGVTAEGSRTTLGLRVFDTQREYLSDLIGDEHSTGVSIVASRQMAVNASIDLRASYVDRQRDETLFVVGEPIEASHIYETDLILSANRDFGPRIVVSLETGFFANSGTTDAEGWWAGIRGRWFPEFGQ